MDFGKKRLGNWIVTKYNKDGVPFIKVSPSSGEFSWEYSSLDEMFLYLESALDDEDSHRGLQVCLSIMNHFIHAKDPIFYVLYLRCLEEYAKIAEERNPTTREEELRIVEELRVEYELGEELKKASDGEEGKTDSEV